MLLCHFNFIVNYILFVFIIFDHNSVPPVCSTVICNLSVAGLRKIWLQDWDSGVKLSARCAVPVSSLCVCSSCTSPSPGRSPSWKWWVLGVHSSWSLMGIESQGFQVECVLVLVQICVLVYRYVLVSNSWSEVIQMCLSLSTVRSAVRETTRSCCCCVMDVIEAATRTAINPRSPPYQTETGSARPAYPRWSTLGDH